jgi:hypothetical protein
MALVVKIERLAPGFWKRFTGAAEAALRSANYRRPNEVWAGPVEVTSWYRTSGKNRRVGGHPDSQHLIGLAFDVGGPNFHRAAVPLRQAGFVVVEERDHLHVQALAAGVPRESGLMEYLGL